MLHPFVASYIHPRKRLACGDYPDFGEGNLSFAVFLHPSSTCERLSTKPALGAPKRASFISAIPGEYSFDTEDHPRASVTHPS
jgi:hypothetical protein